MFGWLSLLFYCVASLFVFVIIFSVFFCVGHFFLSSYFLSWMTICSGGGHSFSATSSFFVCLFVSFFLSTYITFFVLVFLQACTLFFWFFFVFSNG